MTRLQDILYKVHLQSVVGTTDVAVADIQIDSRKVRSGSVFVAIRGALSDGHTFIDKAIHSGATVIVCEEMPAKKKDDITYIQVKNTSEAVAFIAHNF